MRSAFPRIFAVAIALLDLLPLRGQHQLCTDFPYTDGSLSGAMVASAAGLNKNGRGFSAEASKMQLNPHRHTATIAFLAVAVGVVLYAVGFVEQIVDAGVQARSFVATEV